jgi:gluconokinase
MAMSSMSTAESRRASDAVAAVVMGVSGAGKTTVGRGLAEALGGVFIDGDDLHTDDARAKMRSGHALTDEDRWPWLDRIGAMLAVGLKARRPTVVARSALRRAYRDRRRRRGPH